MSSGSRTRTDWTQLGLWHRGGKLGIFTVKGVLQWEIWVSSDLTACTAIVMGPVGGSDWAFLVPAPVFGPKADDIYQRDDARTHVSRAEKKTGTKMEPCWKEWKLFQACFFFFFLSFITYFLLLWVMLFLLRDFLQKRWKSLKGSGFCFQLKLKS